MQNSQIIPKYDAMAPDSSITERANESVGDIQMPDPFEVAKMLGNKSDRFDLQLRQSLMSEILENAPQRPLRKSPSRAAQQDNGPTHRATVTV